MSGARTGSAFLVAMLATMVLPCVGIAQVQQGVYQRSAYPTSSASDATADPSAANPAGTNSGTASPAGVSGGASSWTAGKGSFGITAKTSTGSSAGATGGSWGAGSGSFGIKNQPSGIWRDSGGGSMGTPSGGPTQSSAARGLVPETTPGLSAKGPATGGAPGGARSSGILASRSHAGAHPTSSAHFGVSSGFRSGGNRSVGGKPGSPGAHRRPGTKGHAGSSHGSGEGSSSSHAKTRAPSAFTPSGSSTTGGMGGGMGQPGSGREPIP
jgi:hypothetical protein